MLDLNSNVYSLIYVVQKLFNLECIFADHDKNKVNLLSNNLIFLSFLK